MAGVTFSDSDSAPVPKFLNPDPGPKIFQIWESDSYSDSGYHRRIRNSAMYLFSNEMTLIKTAQTPASAENDNWFRIRVRFFTNFWLRIRVRKKNAETCRSRLRHSASVATSSKRV